MTKRPSPAAPFQIILFLTLTLSVTACALLPGQAVPALQPDPPPPAAYETLTAVTHLTPIPARDMAALAAQFGALRPLDAHPTLAARQPKETETFWYKNMDSGRNEQIEADLIYQSDQLNLWLEAGQSLPAAAVQAAAQTIEADILPTTRAFFGSPEAGTPLNILHLHRIGGVAAAYFSAADAYSTAVTPYSNQRPLLYLSLSDAELGSDRYYNTIAHEYQHLLQWRIDANEDGWLNEGFSQLAAQLNGYPPDNLNAYADRTDIPLHNLSHDADTVAAHYAAAYLFTQYFLDRFGPDAARAWVRLPESGVGGVEAALAQTAPDLTFNDLFADWVAHTYLSSIQRETAVPPTIAPPPLQSRRLRLPAADRAAVHQYGADILRWTGDEPVTLIFTGTQQVDVIPTAPHDGRFWFTYPADESDMRLTRAFDLTGLNEATLTYHTWYDIETGWDYAYVAVSTDNGRSWTPLEPPHTTRDNPQGNSFGPAYTGLSGGGDAPVWIEESIDLTPYTGQPILLRFQYVTDDAVHHHGFALDDIAVPQLAFRDDAETDAAAWEAAGFFRSSRTLPQRFLLQTILLSDTDAQITRLWLNENQQGGWEIPLNENYNEAILIIAGSTPLTRQTAVYEYKIKP